MYIGGNPYGGSACPTTAHCKNWMNAAAFTANVQPTTGTPVNYGNVAKGSYTGPRYTDLDMAIARDFPFTEFAALQFRAEYFNLFNHTNFGDPNTTLNGTFGEITSTSPQLGGAANDPRIAQFSLKLIF